jgi:hypothetical protein
MPNEAGAGMLAKRLNNLQRCDDLGVEHESNRDNPAGSG